MLYLRIHFYIATEFDIKDNIFWLGISCTSNKVDIAQGINLVFYREHTSSVSSSFPLPFFGHFPLDIFNNLTPTTSEPRNPHAASSSPILSYSFFSFMTHNSPTIHSIDLFSNVNQNTLSEPLHSLFPTSKFYPALLFTLSSKLCPPNYFLSLHEKAHSLRPSRLSSGFTHNLKLLKNKVHGWKEWTWSHKPFDCTTLCRCLLQRPPGPALGLGDKARPLLWTQVQVYTLLEEGLV